MKIGVNATLFNLRTNMSKVTTKAKESGKKTKCATLKVRCHKKSFISLFTSQSFRNCIA